MNIPIVYQEYRDVLLPYKYEDLEHSIHTINL